MNLSTISTASIATLKSFARANNLLPTGDLRLKSTCLEVVQTFLTAAQEIAQETIEGAVQLAQEIATYDNAVIAANTVNVITRKSIKFTAQSLWSVLLVSIALSCIALDLWQDRAETKAFLVQVLSHAKTKAISKAKDRWVIWTEMGDAIVQLHITEPVNEMRGRVQRAKSAIVSG